MLEKIGMGILTKMVKEVWERFKDRHQKSKNASHDYSRYYKKRHGQLIVTCVGMEAARSLDDVYVAVQFLDKRRAATYGSTEDIEEAFREMGERHFNSASDKRQNGMRVANNEQYLMVLGGPGVGKSTFLRKIGLEALKREDGNFEHECTPVFLELKRFTEDQIDIEAWITDEFKVCGYPYPEQIANTKLESGELLVLFDGLDEVSTSNVNDVIRKIGDFVDQYSQNRFIVSSRIGAYKGGFNLFTAVEVAEFDDSQIQVYINNWFASDSNRKMETAQRCWKALDAPEHQAIKTLAQNPLVLTFLCSFYGDNQKFPRNQAELYERALNIFLEEWPDEKFVSRGSQYLDIGTVERIISEIASRNFEAGSLHFKKRELVNQMQEFGKRSANKELTSNASKILNAILVDPGIFVERFKGIYTFFHLTFQEYLTANHFVRTQSIRRLVSDHLHNDRWREVFLLTAGLMREADNLLVAMGSEAAKLIDTPGLKELFRWAERITDTTDDRYEGIAKRLFALRQYFSLWLLNKIYEVVENVVNHDGDVDPDLDGDLYLGLYLDLDLAICFNLNKNLNRDFYLDLNRNLYCKIYEVVENVVNHDGDVDPDLDGDLYLGLYLDLDLAICFNLNKNLNRDFYLDLNRNLYCDLDRNLYPHLDLYLGLYFDLDLEIYLYLYLYQDFYQYMGTNFYFLVFSVFGDLFDKELGERISVVECMEQMKIFKTVDLQRMVDRFNAQREFIEAAGREESVEPLAESIHDTWLSVLGITDDMLAISHEEMGNYIQYLRAVDLIVACKEAAGRVSCDEWQQIEDRFLTVDAADIKN